MTHGNSGKVGIVTGGAGGIGAAVCQRLAADGHHVVVAYLSAADAASQLVAQITAAGHSASAVRVDVSESDEVAALFADVRARYGRIDIVINNAGVIMLRRLAELTVEIYEHVFGVNVRGALNVLRETAQHLSDNGRVVNTSSTLVGAPIAGSAAYVASKAALELLTPVAAQELGPRGITVNALRVGPTVPGMFSTASPERQAALAAASPFKRLGTPEDIADVVGFLVSDAARWITGQVLTVDGGTMLARLPGDTM